MSFFLILSYWDELWKIRFEKLRRVQHKVVPIINAALKTFTKKKGIVAARIASGLRADVIGFWLKNKYLC